SYATSGYGSGCYLIEITGKGSAFQAKRVYSNKVMKNTIGGVVLVGGDIFGNSEKAGWLCQDFKNGKAAWDDSAVLGPGAVVAADGRLYCYGEDDGVCCLVEPSKEKWVEKGRFEIPEKSKLRKPKGRIWTPPVLP